MNDNSLEIGFFKQRSWLKLWVLCVIVAGLVVVVLANIHLVYVAFTSQPDCIPHLKELGAEGTFRAAQSSC